MDLGKLGSNFTRNSQTVIPGMLHHQCHRRNRDEDDSDPLNDEEAEVGDEEGELYYAKQDEISTIELDESNYRRIFGESDNENDFEGF